jgi:hypothetical protein
MRQAEQMTRQGLRTPRSAAVAGIVFSVLLAVALVLLIISVPHQVGSAGQWLAHRDRRSEVSVALNLVPFAGIAFLWFIGVLRDRIGQHEDRFFATVFLGSGLLFVAMLFVAAAFAGGVISDAALRAASTTQPATLTLGRQVSSLVLRVYAMRMAGVFTLNTAMIVLRTGVITRWIGWAGVASAVVLLVTLGLSPWVELVFPAWVLVVSIDILWRGRWALPDTAPGAPPT